MTIGIDASRALRPIKTGTEWYSVEIIRHLVESDQKNHYILYSQTPPTEPLINLPENSSWRVMPFPRGWTLFRLSLEMKQNPPDVLFIPAHTLPLIHPKKSVVMIHDLGFMENPELYPARQKIYHNFVINYVIKHAAHIITPSEYTTKNIISRFNYSPEKITTIWHGIDHKLYKPTQNTNHRSGKIGDYIFYIGRLETKKNIVNLVKAFEIFRSSCHPDSYCHPQQSEGSLSKSPKLVLGGKPSHGYEQIKETIARSPFKNDIIELGYIPEEEVPVWLSNAKVFAFPTSFEGFGFPVIQAMACGTPVIASNNTCIPEISGDAALLIDPQKPEEIAEVIAKILTDKKLANQLKKKGLNQSKHFTWESSAKQTLNILNKVGESG
jgi:glycosyltransferase involved in cell wall biosynthesis